MAPTLIADDVGPPPAAERDWNLLRMKPRPFLDVKHLKVRGPGQTVSVNVPSPELFTARVVWDGPCQLPSGMG